MLRLEAARHRLGLVRGQDLVDAAVAAMVEGLESESLVLLAGELDPILSDAVPLFERALEELGIVIPDNWTASWILARHILGSVASGGVEPQVGVHALINEVDAGRYDRAAGVECVGESMDLDEIIGTFYSLDDIHWLLRPSWFFWRSPSVCVAEIEARLKELAVEWLERHPEGACPPTESPLRHGDATA